MSGLESRPASLPGGDPLWSEVRRIIAPLSAAERVQLRKALVAVQDEEARAFEASSRRRTSAGKRRLVDYQIRAARLRAVDAKAAGRRT
jgi:hypothetical protein